MFGWQLAPVRDAFNLVMINLVKLVDCFIYIVLLKMRLHMPLLSSFGYILITRNILTTFSNTLKYYLSTIIWKLKQNYNMWDFMVWSSNTICRYNYDNFLKRLIIFNYYYWSYRFNIKSSILKDFIICMYVLTVNVSLRNKKSPVKFRFVHKIEPVAISKTCLL